MVIYGKTEWPWPNLWGGNAAGALVTEWKSQSMLEATFGVLPRKGGNLGGNAMISRLINGQGMKGCS